MYTPLKILLSSTCICLLAVYIYTSLHTTGTPISLPAPADISNIPRSVNLAHLTVDLIPGAWAGESLVTYQGDVVTGTLDGYLVAVHPDTLEIRWKIQCPVPKSGGRCRILGLRAVGEALIGVDLFGRVFKFQSGEFEWLFESSSPDIARLGPGYFNDLVVHRDVVYVTDSFTAREDKQHLNLFQRFYSFEADGKIIAYNMTSGEAWIFADNLHIPNGIELHRNNKTLLVSESNMYRIIELDVETGARVGVFSAGGTLGVVDNIRRAPKGGYWLGVSTGRTTTLHIADILARFPLLRHVLTQYQRTFSILGRASKSCVEAPRFYKVDETGVAEAVVFGDESFTETNAFSEVLEVGRFVFLGTPSSKSIFRVTLHEEE